MNRVNSNNISEISDADLQTGEFQFTDEVFQTKISKGLKNALYPFHQTKINEFEFDFIKSYLFSLYESVRIDSNIEIIAFNTHASLQNPIVIAPQIRSRDENNNVILENQLITVDIGFGKSQYQMSIYMRVDAGPGFDVINNYYVAALGIEPESITPSGLIDYVYTESLKNSFYRNKIISLKTNPTESQEVIKIDTLPVTEFENETIDEIYIPDNIKNEFIRFENTIKNYKNIRYGLRYLLCGEPGTGKTKTIRAMINLCFGHATIILVQGHQKLKTAIELS